MQFITGSQIGFDAAARVGEISCFGAAGSGNNSDHLYRRMWYAMQFDSVMSTDSTPSSFMDITSSAPEFLPDLTRKRPLEQLETENGIAKKYNLNGVNSETIGEHVPVYHFKLLIPSAAAGAIIGKGGETIAQLQREKKAKIKMSKANDYYPGTTERVCIISSSSPESIMAVLVFVMEKIREKPELTKPVVAEINTTTATTATTTTTSTTAEREKQVKILVPNTTAGMIIGKGGSYIKQIKEQTGAYIQLSQKPKDVSLPERCITVSGDIEMNTKVCELVLQKIMEDPQSGSCPNLSYADIAGPVANFSPTGSPYATIKSVGSVGAAAAGGGCGAGMGAVNLNGAFGSGLNICLSLPNSVDTLVAAKIAENISLTLHSSGFSETTVTEITAALSILARYGMLGVSYGLANVGSNNAVIPSHKLEGGGFNVNAFDISALTAANNLLNTIGTTAAAAISPQSSLDASTLDIFHPSQFNNLSAAAAGNNCFSMLCTNDVLTDVTAVAAAEIKKVDIEVPEGVLSCLLGRSLLDVQYHSGAVVHISAKRNSAFPSACNGNGNGGRIISITGTPAAIAAARILIEQKVNECFAKVVTTAAAKSHLSSSSVE